MLCNSAVVIITCLLLQCVTCYEPLTEDIHTYDGADFSEVIKATLFVDKTLLMKQIYTTIHHGEGILILAPRRYGKSTNMDMMRRFFQVNINNTGHLMEVEDTFNYNLFRNNYLKIYQDESFFHERFGRHPVISIDYEPLGKVTTVEQMLAIFLRKIMMETFLQHKYLLHDDFLWSMNDTFGWIRKQQFEQYLNSELNYKLSEADVQTGFSFLARLLHKRFDQRVTVLLDNYDVIVDSPLFSSNPNVYHFIGAVNSDILRSDSVERSVVTGRVRPSGPSVDRGELLPGNIRESEAHHRVWEYYGLNGEELDNLLEPMVPDEDRRREAVGKIVESYSGYSVATFEAGEDDEGQLLDTQACSVWSVMQYLERELAVENFSSVV